MLEKIKRKINKVENEKLYTPDDIEKLGVVLDANLNPSKFKVYRLIKRGDLASVNLGKGTNPKYFVRGRDLKRYVRDTWKIKK